MRRCAWPNCRGVLFSEPPDPDVRYHGAVAVAEFRCFSCGRGEHETAIVAAPVAICNRIGCLKPAGATGLCHAHQSRATREAAGR